MERFRKNLPNLEIDDREVPAIDLETLIEHLERNGEEVSRSERFGVERVESGNGKVEFEVGITGEETYIEIRAPEVENMEEYGEKIFDDKLRPLYGRNIRIIQAADEYIDRIESAVEDLPFSIKEVVRAEIGSSGENPIEEPGNLLELNFQDQLEGDRSDKIDSNYETAPYFQAYKERVLKALDQRHKNYNFSKIWLDHAST
jgi:hypothetical protein